MIETIHNKKEENKLSRDDVIYGVKMAIPICIGYIPLGIASGILSQKAGLSPIEIGFLSLFVFAGSGQFITSSMLIAHSSMFSIILTTFIVNLRHILMSSTLSQYFSKCNKKFLLFFSHEITDETFAINLIKFKEGRWNTRRATILNIVSHSTWILSNILDGVTGSIFNFNDTIINFVLTSMFICLLCLQLKGGIYILCAVISGFTAVNLSLIMNNNLYVIIATLLSATLCYFVEKFIKIRKGV